MADQGSVYLAVLLYLVTVAVPVCMERPSTTQDYCIVSQGSGIICNSSLRYGEQSQFQAKNISIQCEGNSSIHINATHSLLLQLTEENRGICPTSRVEIDQSNFTSDCSMVDDSSENPLLKDLRNICNDRAECEPSPLYYSSSSIHHDSCHPQGVANFSYLPIVMVEYFCLQKTRSARHAGQQPIIFTQKLQQTGTNILLQSNDYSQFARANWTTKLNEADVAITLAFNISSTYCQIMVPPMTLARIGGPNLLFKKVYVLENGNGFTEVTDQHCQCRIYVESSNGSYSEHICTENRTFKLPCGKTMETFNLYNINDFNDTIGIIFEIPLTVETGQALNVSCGFKFSEDTAGRTLTPPVIAEPTEIQQSINGLEGQPPLRNSISNLENDSRNGVFRWDILLGTLLSLALVVFGGLILLLVSRRNRRKLNIQPTRPTTQRISTVDIYDEPDLKENNSVSDEGDYSTIRISGTRQHSATVPKRNDTSNVDESNSEANSPFSIDRSTSQTTPIPPPKRPLSGNLLQVLRTKFKFSSERQIPDKVCENNQRDLTKKVEGIELPAHLHNSPPSAVVQETAFVNEGLTMDEPTEVNVETTGDMITNDIYEFESSDNQRSSCVSGRSEDVRDSGLYEEVGDITNAAASIHDHGIFADELVLTEPEPIVIKIKDSPVSSPVMVNTLSENGSNLDHSINQASSLSDIEEEDDGYLNESESLADMDTTQPSDYFTDDYSEVRRKDGTFVVGTNNNMSGGDTSNGLHRKDQLTPRLSYTEMVDNDVYNI